MRQCIRCVRGKPIDRVRFNGDDRMHQVVVACSAHVRRKNRRQAAAQLGEPDCRRGSTTCNLRLCCKMPLVFSIGSEGEDIAQRRPPGKAVTPLALMP